jgi:Flp pilus assembly protein TadD
METSLRAASKYGTEAKEHGDVLVRQGENEEALSYLKRAIENRHDYIPARVVLARALMNLERWPDAIRELKTAIGLDPKYPQPHLLLSQIYFRLGDEEHARKEKETSLHLRRENPALLEALQARPFP